MLNSHFSAAEAIADYSAQIAAMAPGTSLRDDYRRKAAGAAAGTRAAYDPEILEMERVSQGRASLSDAEQAEVLDQVIKDQAGTIGLSAGQLDDVLIQVAGGDRHPEAKARALAALAALRGGQQILNGEAEIISLSRSGKVGRQPLESADDVRKAWTLLHSMGNKQFFDDAALHGSIAAKIRAKARSKRVQLHDDPGQHTVGEGPGPGGGEGASGETSFSSLTLALTSGRAQLDANGDVVTLAGDEYPSAFKSPPPSSDRPKVKIRRVSQDDTESQTEIDKIIKRSLEHNDGIFGSSMSKETPYGSARTYKPSAYVSPGPSGKPQTGY